MRDLSLHILDLIENSIRAGASVIAVTVKEYPERDLLHIAVEDNGPGLKVAVGEATDPFYTTKSGKRTGLGLSLFRAAAERAGGNLRLGVSDLGGTAVEAQMQLSHMDRSPLGDLATTLSSIVCTNPGLDLRLRLGVGEREWLVSVNDVMGELVVRDNCGLAAARRVSERIKTGLSNLHVSQ